MAIDRVLPPCNWLRSGRKTRRSIEFFFSSRRRHTRYIGDWSSDVCSSDLYGHGPANAIRFGIDAATAPVTVEIGRASCRERVEISVGAGGLKKKEEEQRHGESPAEAFSVRESEHVCDADVRASGETDH